MKKPSESDMQLRHFKKLIKTMPELSDEDRKNLIVLITDDKLNYKILIGSKKIFLTKGQVENCFDEKLSLSDRKQGQQKVLDVVIQKL